MTILKPILIIILVILLVNSNVYAFIKIAKAVTDKRLAAEKKQKEEQEKLDRIVKDKDNEPGFQSPEDFAESIRSEFNTGDEDDQKDR